MRYRETNKYSFQEYYFRRDFSWRRIGWLWTIVAAFCLIGYANNSSSSDFWLGIFIGAIIVSSTSYVGLLWSKAYFESRSIGTATWDTALMSSDS